MKRYLVLKNVALSQTMLERDTIVVLDEGDEGNKLSKAGYVKEYIEPKPDKRGKNA